MRLEIYVGSDFYDSTDDWIRFKFMNGDGATCYTEFLNGKFSLSVSGTKVVIEDSETLGDCRSGLFRPDEELKPDEIEFKDSCPPVAFIENGKFHKLDTWTRKYQVDREGYRYMPHSRRPHDIEPYQ